MKVTHFWKYYCLNMHREARYTFQKCFVLIYRILFFNILEPLRNFEPFTKCIGLMCRAPGLPLHIKAIHFSKVCCFHLWGFKCIVQDCWTPFAMYNMFENGIPSKPYTCQNNIVLKCRGSLGALHVKTIQFTLHIHAINCSELHCFNLWDFKFYKLYDCIEYLEI